MIIHPKPFREKIEENISLYSYILLYFERNPKYVREELIDDYKIDAILSSSLKSITPKYIKKEFDKKPIKNNKSITSHKISNPQIILTNSSEEELRYILSYYPLLIIYDRDKVVKNKKDDTDLKPLLVSILQRKLSSSNTEDIMGYFNHDINYKYIIENKESIINKIGNVYVLEKILSEFKKLDKYFLKESNYKAIRKRTDLPIEDFMKPTIIYKEESGVEFMDYDYSNYNYVSGYFQKKNINHILKKYNSLELKQFFYYENIKDTKGKSEKEDLKIDRNIFYKKDTDEMLSLLRSNTSIAENIYKELLKEIEFCNLYEWTHSLDTYEFEDLFLKLYSSIGENQITSISDDYTNSDYLKELSNNHDFICEEKVSRIIREEFYEYCSYDGSEFDEDKTRSVLLKELKHDYSELQMIDSYIEDIESKIQLRREEIEDECMEDLKEVSNEDYLHTFIQRLNQGKTKHSKYLK